MEFFNPPRISNNIRRQAPQPRNRKRVTIVLVSLVIFFCTGPLLCACGTDRHWRSRSQKTTVQKIRSGLWCVFVPSQFSSYDADHWANGWLHNAKPKNKAPFPRIIKPSSLYLDHQTLFLSCSLNHRPFPAASSR